MIGTRPDILYAVTHLSQFSTNPSDDHYQAVLHVCHYLVGTQDYRIVYLSKQIKDYVLIWTPIGLLIRSGGDCVEIVELIFIFIV